MSMVELIREGFRDEPDVEAFVQKYEVWEALVQRSGDSGGHTRGGHADDRGGSSPHDGRTD